MDPLKMVISVSDHTTWSGKNVVRSKRLMVKVAQLGTDLRAV